MIRLLICLFMLIGFVACGVEYQTEDYHLTSAADIVLTSQNHPHGYAKSQCYLCHNLSNFHQVNRVNAPSFSLAKPLVQQSGLASCSGCHGTNGVP